MRKYLKYLFLLLIVLPLNVKAEEIDISKIGSFKFNYFYKEKALDGEIKLYKIATIDTNGKYNYTSDYKLEDSLEIDSISQLNNLALKINNYIDDNNIKELDSCKPQNGQCQISNLNTGLYLVTSSEVTDINYIYKVSPTLIAIPNYNELDKVYIYDEDIILKTEAKAINVDNNTNTASNNNSNSNSKIPKTMDKVYNYLLIFIVSIAIMIVLVFYINNLRKKEKKNEKNN